MQQDDPLGRKWPTGAEQLPGRTTGTGALANVPQEKGCKMSWRPLVVLVLGMIFAGSLYLGLTLQSQAEISTVAQGQFIEQLNAGAFVSLERSGAFVHGETATGDILAAEIGGGGELAAELAAAGGNEAIVAQILAEGEAEPLGVRLARTLLWVGPLLLVICLIFVVVKGQGALETA